jgi:hypothetical protein
LFPELVLGAEVLEHFESNDGAIDTNDDMEEEEEQEEAIVVETHCLVDPHAVMVKLLYANTTHATMLRPCWLVYLTSRTLVLLLEHHPVVRVPFDSLNDICPFSFTAEFARINPAGSEVTGIAEHHDHGANVFVVPSHIWIGHQMECLRHVHIEPSKGAHKVHDLHQWVRLIADVVGRALNQFEEALAARLFDYVFEEGGKFLGDQNLSFGQTPTPMLIDTNEQIEEGHC